MKLPRDNMEAIYRSYLLPDLPRVRLSAVPNTAYSEHSIVDEEADVFSVRCLLSGSELGFIALMYEEPTENGSFAYIDNVMKIDQRAAKGAFLAAYVALGAHCQSEGYSLRSGLILSKHSLKIWNILVGAGIADNPLTFVREIHDGDPYFYGTAYMRSTDDIFSNTEKLS